MSLKLPRRRCLLLELGEAAAAASDEDDDDGGVGGPGLRCRLRRYSDRVKGLAFECTVSAVRCLCLLKAANLRPFIQYTEDGKHTRFGCPSFLAL